MAVEEWRICTIDQIQADARGAIAIGPFGSRMKGDRYVSRGVPVIRGNNIGDTRSFVGDFVYVTGETADELRSSNVFPGDLVLPHRGAIGTIGIVPSDGPNRYVLSTSLMKLTCNSKIIDPVFVFYFFRSSVGRHELLKHASTVGTPGIGQPLASLKGISLPLPPLSEQRAIARILGALDDKIELNRRMNETLEAIARALFKSWFVDFDPVRAKAAGREPSLPKPIVGLFPDAFEASELGEIPKGWRVSQIAELARIVGGSTPSTKEVSFWNDGRHYWATPKDLSALSTPVLLGTAHSITDQGLAQIGSGLLPPGTVLLSSRAPIGYLAVSQVPVAINQGFIAMLPAMGIPKLFLLYWAEWAHEAIVSRANGSTFLEISKASFRPIPVVTPPNPVLGAFEQVNQPVYDRIVTNEKESHTIATLRDTLLPKLISGELRVKEAERVLAEAV